MQSLLTHCLRADTRVPERTEVASWFPRWRDGAARAESPLHSAVLGGFDADRVGWAFACGYQAALRVLMPTLPTDSIASFCVTEAGGNRPRDIATRFTALHDGRVRIDGSKRWTTLGPNSGWLLVVGAMPAASELAKPALKVALVNTQAAGVQLHTLADTSFVPEVPHARLELQGVLVAADALLSGDGYSGYVKPFRSIEDTYVALAVLAYLLREARARDWPKDFAEQVCALLEALAAVARGVPDEPAMHISLAGALHWAHRLYSRADELWARMPHDATTLRWQRDAPLFQVAAAAREMRAQRAWQRLS